MKKILRAAIASLMALICFTPAAVNAEMETFERGLETDIETSRLYIQVKDPVEDSVFTKSGQTVQLVIMDYEKREETENILFGCDNGEVVDIVNHEIKPAVIETGSTPLEGDALYIDLEAKHNGTANLRIQTSDLEQEVIIQMTVKDPSYAVSSIAIDSEVTIEPGETYAIQYEILPDTAENKTVTWESDHPEIAAVDESGTVKGIKTGEAVITATTEDGGFTSTCHVNVKKAVKKITLNETEIYLLAGKTRQLTAKITPPDADAHIIWSTSDEGIAVANDEGLVTANKEGTVVITAEDLDTMVSAKCTVHVVKKMDAKAVDMYRLYNPNSGEHFYTAKQAECDALVVAGWIYEGIGWTAPSKSYSPVYRLYNKNAGDHHYTMKAGERDALVKIGWTDEGIGWYSDDAETVPVYREYNPNMKANNHNYTPSKAEHDTLVSYGWNDEGIGWYAMKEGKKAVKVSSLGKGKSPFYIKVNRTANTVTIYCKDAEGKYTTAYKVLVCSCGVSAHKTPKQTFVTGQKLRWHHLIHGVSGQYCTRFAGNSKYRDILFHSVPYNKYEDPSSLQYEEFNKLGSHASAGCVRLCVRDAKWIYDTVPAGTTIVVYEDSNPGPLGKPTAVKIDTSSKNRGWDPTDPNPKNPWN